MEGTDGKVFGSRSIHFKLARLLIAFIADDIIQLLCKYIFSQLVRLHVIIGAVLNRVRQVNSSIFGPGF